MQFELDDTTQAIRETARRFSDEKLAPHYKSREQDGRFDRDLLREMGGLGLVAPDLPEEYGGIGASGLTQGVVIEEISHGDMNVGYVQLLGSLIGGVLANHAPKAIAEAVLPEIAEGRLLPALGLTEPRGGTDAANLQLRARRDSGDWVLDGEKASISCANQADAILVAARTGDPDSGARGVTAFWVDLNVPGIARSAYDDLGSNAVGRGSVWFDGVRIPDECRIGDEGMGFIRVMQGFDYSRALIALQCLGAARASLDETWPYTIERQAFGAPLASFQGVSFPLAEADAQIRAARLLAYECLWLRDNGLPHTKEAAMVKWMGPKVSVDAIHQCLLTHGHLGYSRDLPHQQRMRDVMGLEIGDGTAQVSKLIIARETVGRAAVQYAKP
ncbi:MAG: acyl-CoA dehydrogenase family protein [Alphaproteobacteria bacterium]